MSVKNGHCLPTTRVWAFVNTMTWERHIQTSQKREAAEDRMKVKTSTRTLPEIMQLTGRLMVKPGLLHAIRDDKRKFYRSGCSHASDHIKTSKPSRKLTHHFFQASLTLEFVVIRSTKA